MSERLNAGQALEGISGNAFCLIPVGLPGSGKSALGQLLLERGYLTADAIISTDRLRLAVGGRRDWLGDEELVFRHANEILEARLRNGIPVFLDATNLDADRRRHAIAAGQRWMRPTMLVRCSGDPAACRARRSRLGVDYGDDTWSALVRAMEDIDWNKIPSSWIDRAELERMVCDQAGGPT